MADTTKRLAEMSASQWLAVRDAVADGIKRQAPQSNSQVRVAEWLLRQEWIDVAQVQAGLNLKPAPVAEGHGVVTAPVTVGHN